MKIEAGKVYRTRSGIRVEVRDIRMKGQTGSLATFPVKGHMVTTLPSGRKHYGYNAWKLDGSYMPCWEHEHDLIEEIIE